MTITLRAAAAQDMDWLMVQLRAFDQFASYKRSLVEDDAHARLALKHLVENHVCIIAEGSTCEHVGDCPGGTPCLNRLGFIAGYRAPHPFNPKINVLNESFWWVSPEHRKTRAGIMLLDQFTDIGKRLGDWVVMTLEHHSPVADRHLTKRGYVPREQTFLLEV